MHILMINIKTLSYVPYSIMQKTYRLLIVDVTQILRRKSMDLDDASTEGLIMMYSLRMAIRQDGTELNTRV